jgi:hypothetical protein
VKDKVKECKRTGRWCIKKELNMFQVLFGYFTLKMHPLNLFYQPAQSVILKDLNVQRYLSDNLRFRTAV